GTPPFGAAPGVPGPGDSAVIGNGATVDLGGGGTTVSVHNVTLSGGSTLMNGSIRIVGANGAFNWTSGTVACNCTIPADGSLNIRGDVTRVLGSNAVITQGGTGLWSGATNIAAKRGSGCYDAGQWLSRAGDRD